MYRIEYDIETGRVNQINPTETQETPLIDGIAFYEGEIPEDREGFTKELYWGINPDDVNPLLKIAESQATLYAVYTVIEGWIELANAEDVEKIKSDVNLISRKPQGLKFKAGDNTVFAKTMKALVLGTGDFTVCVVARGEGSDSVAPFFGLSKNIYSASSLHLYNNPSLKGANGFQWIRMQANMTTEWANSILIDKTDNTTNLHHIVITRSGTLVTATINGRLVKSVTQDSVLDFSNFIYDIANTSYFWGGAVFNYAMTQVESNKLLWNGGRYDEVRLPETMKIYNANTIDFISSDALGGTSTLTKYDNYIDVTINSGTSDAAYPRLFSKPAAKNKGVFCTVEIDCEPIGGDFIIGRPVVLFEGLLPSDNKQVTISGRTKIIRSGVTTYSGDLYTALGNVSNVGKTLRIHSYKVVYHQALLEYRPENIREDRYLNSGTMGAEYDLVYSTVKPEIIFEKPYADKVMLDENKAPDWHPIAMGQEVETPVNIFKAKLPALGDEWSVSDWKQINN